jgi:threonine/homoserine/homoserine lactone efflux protein
LLAISVGPIVFTVIKQSLNNGLKGGLGLYHRYFSFRCFPGDLLQFFTQFFKVLSNYDTQLGIAGSILLMLVGVYFFFLKK